MGWKTLDEMDLAGKTVLTRVDINVPVENVGFVHTVFVVENFIFVVVDWGGHCLLRSFLSIGRWRIVVIVNRVLVEIGIINAVVGDGVVGTPFELRTRSLDLGLFLLQGH